MTFFTMKTLPKPIFLFLPLLVLLVFQPSQMTSAQDGSISPTPTYDPLVEPPLPEAPTEYELGRNLYWHWCMTCHGDSGQGLTDEFRAIWDPEHQNCWGRGCHAGRPGEGGFPIPTVVPALVDDSHLARFELVQDLSNFLKTTHPPQSPGILKNEEYHAIGLFVFTMNERSLIDIPVTDLTTPTSKPTLIPQEESALNSLPPYAIIIFIVLVVGVFVVAKRTHLQT